MFELKLTPQENGAALTAARPRAWARPSVLAAIATTVGITVAASPAFATFPGENGRVVYVGNPHMLFLTGKGQLTAPPPLVYDLTPAISPDGTQVAFMRQTPVVDGYIYQLMVVGTDGTGLRVVTSSRAFDPDGIAQSRLAPGRAAALVRRLQSGRQ
jgi:hypothetical protein